ncbi:AraC family transcriptional regulator [Olsenella sp. YH-ols2221]|uniref:AraC family transcriptional regulator n=1 Tax=Olsenella kribbiana TaxID=3115221 RepID=UPI002A8DB00D|nr:AraC family transcriptional regulator [Atopobiaceae bacterium]
MLTYTMDIEKRSTWFRSTPSETGRSLPFFCTEAGTFYARERFVTERSHKDAYLVFYTLGGAGIIEQGGQSVTLGQNQALLMDCRAPQRYVTDPVRHHWYHLWAHVNGAGADAISQAMGLPKLQPVSLPLADVKPIFETIFENMKKEGYIESLTTSLAVDRLLTSIALAPDSRGSFVEFDAVSVARRYMEEHYAEDLHVDDVAREAAISTSQLIRLFKRQLGTTPHSYLLRYRITQAKELLAETTIPVATIARQVGFASESNFSYRFGEMCGQSPSAYRAGAPRLYREVQPG